MKASLKLEGFKELDDALGELPKSAGRTVLTRTLRVAAKPIVDLAAELAPKLTGRLALSIVASTRLANKVGSSEYRAVLVAGGSKEDAAKALRSARRAAKGEGSFAELHIGPTHSPHAVPQEFGTVNMPPHPYMRPAWDAKWREALDIIRAQLAIELDRWAQRWARKVARLAAKNGG